MKVPRVAVLQFPGVNCENETLLALRRVGLDGDVFRWTRRRGELRDYQAYVLPGGFSYQDRVRAGALASKDPLLDVLASEVERGKPVMGICNGAQVLVESGMVPGGNGVELALARNRMRNRTGYYARWVYVRVDESPCVFTRHLDPGDVLPLPVAHGEGRFVSRDTDRMASLRRSGQAPMVYTRADGADAAGFPDNPNGSENDVAAVCNGPGNVLALMPHPERAQSLGALPASLCGEWGDRRLEARRQGSAGGTERPGPGLSLFEGLRRHLMEDA